MPMFPIRPSRPNAYTGSPLDRASIRREAAEWIAQARAGADSVFVPVWQARFLLRGLEAGRPEAAFLSGEAAAALQGDDAPWAFLGLWRERPVFAVDLSAAAEPPNLLPPAEATFADLRGTAGLLPADDAAILAHARGLMHWRARTRFCSACGEALTLRSAGNVLTCPGCAIQHFPRTDPAVIMLVVHEDRALLGHSQRFPNATMYSTLAGFVEPGESLEEAVAREVAEEAGIRVGRVFYHSSQPWPFPASIMLGFHAEALSEDITIDRDELADARWFTRAELADPAAGGFSLPRGDSIARRLIEDWLEAG